MKAFRGCGFGFGSRIAWTADGHAATQARRLDDAETSFALLFTTLPSRKQLREIAQRTDGSFLVIPSVSQYSHLAGQIWEEGVPVVALSDCHVLRTGMLVRAEFEEGSLCVAETDSECAEFLACRVEPSNQSEWVPISTNARRHKLEIRSEAASARDVDRAFSDGASGLGVIKGEVLQEWDANAVVTALRSNTRSLPLYVRFYDSVRGGGECLGPTEYLGYRGVRLLEVDASLAARFRSDVAKLGLRDDEVIPVAPMVTDAMDVREFMERLGGSWTRCGVTIETPAAAIGVRELLHFVDGVEIGLNDLTQYTMAWSRDYPHERRLPGGRIAEPVGKLIREVARACNDREVLCVLGLDLRPTPSLAAQIEELGVTSISCVPSLVRAWRSVFDSP